MKSFGKKIRALLHDVYYAAHPKKRVDFALRCRHVAEIIDLGEAKSISENLRYHLHLSLCQPCQNYLEMTQALKRAMLDLVKKRKAVVNIDELNRSLLKKYARKPF